MTFFKFLAIISPLRNFPGKEIFIWFLALYDVHTESGTHICVLYALHKLHTEFKHRYVLYILTDFNYIQWPTLCIIGT